jgi:hypothetical protein
VRPFLLSLSSPFFTCGFEFLREFVTNSCVISQPDTTVPYSDTYSGGSLGFNEYVIYDPSHVLIRYLFLVKIKN